MGDHRILWNTLVALWDGYYSHLGFSQWASGLTLSIRVGPSKDGRAVHCLGKAILAQDTDDHT